MVYCLNNYIMLKTIATYYSRHSNKYECYSNVYITIYLHALVILLYTFQFNFNVSCTPYECSCHIYRHRYALLLFTFFKFMHFKMMTCQFKYSLLFEKVRLTYTLNVTTLYATILIYIRFIFFIYVCHNPKWNVAPKSLLFHTTLYYN